MQIDMHYYGVYTLARAAGVNREAAEVIATVAQFVDDNGKSRTPPWGQALLSDVF